MTEFDRKLRQNAEDIERALDTLLEIDRLSGPGDAPERLMQAWEPTDLTDAEIDEMTHENAMRFFRFDPFSIRPREKCTVGALRAEAVGHDVSIQARAKAGAAAGRTKSSDLLSAASGTRR
jgi:hypothetical protein